MNEAAIESGNNLNKIKSLEARLIGPNSNGLLPIEIAGNALNSRSESLGDEKSLTKNNAQNFNAGQNNQNGQNSNQGIMHSSRKKNIPIKAEKKTKMYKNYQIDFLTTRLKKPSGNMVENTDLNLSLHEGSENSQEDPVNQIEFTSKNISSSNGIFANTKENFLHKRERAQPSKQTLPNNEMSLPSSEKKQKVEPSLNPSKEVIEMKVLLSEKDKEIVSLKSKLSDLEEGANNLVQSNRSLVESLQHSKLSLVKYLRELEEIKKNNKKKWLIEQEYKLGRAVLQRVGQTTIEVWEDGEEFIKLSTRMKEIEKDKQEIENQKSNLLSQIRRRNMSSQDANDNLDDFTNLKELLSFKMNNLQKEEVRVKEKFEKLQTEKTLYILERKRIKEEESSRFVGQQSKERYPILSNKYLILGLLGKGGYSEVYRAYDLENHFEVACKVHQLNSQWSDNIKENYIRHTIRENQIHKQIDHSKIVKHYDTIEIDNNSFCSVLELCSGPDLHTYLKMHKTLPEKEARAIITQMLSGLHYMNTLTNRIIHYDLKPQNIVFHNMEVKISDFGLAKIMENNSERVELTSQGVGTYWYLPPECFDMSRHPPGISSKVDIWSLGVILYELLFGARPFGQNCTQDKILKEGIILNAKQVDFPQKPAISKSCRVN